jgi:phosphatidate cytidylyltransferase
MERTLPGLALAACWLLLLLKGTFPLFWGVIALIAFVGGLEYVKMSAPKDMGLLHRIGLSCILILPVLAAGTGSGVGMTGGIFFSFFFLACYILFNFRFVANSFEHLCRYAMGIVYVGFLTSHLVLIRGLPDGSAWLVILSAVTAGSDSGAYYCGRTFGRTKLSPNVSPKKTVEGAVGGLLVGLAFSSFFAWLLLPVVNWWFLLFVSALLTGGGILGDLTESVMKRGTDTKDSGRILAGHGGVLDRIDSLLFAGPLLYYLLVLARVL